MNQFLRDSIPRIAGRRAPIAYQLALVAVLVFLGTGKASAQFGIDSGRDNRAGEGMRDEGRRGSGVGIGIGIGIGVGIGEALVDKAAKDDAKNKSGAGSPARSSGSGLTKYRRAARDGKGDNKPVNAKTPKKDEAKKDEPKNGDDPPTENPAGGIDVPGGKVHLSTGTLTGYAGGPRKGIYCWVHTTDKEKCKRFAQYQFATINIVAKWGNNAEANINADVIKMVGAGAGYILNSNVAHVVPGQLGGDDYNDRNEHFDAKGLSTNAHMTDPTGRDVVAGPYQPLAIPGAGGDKGLIDAPSWNAAVGGWVDKTKLVPEDLRKTPNKPSETQPVDTKVGTIKFLQHFRTYVYCMAPRTCLGFFEWDYDETVTVLMKWREVSSSDLGNKAFGGDLSSGGSKKKGKEPEAPVKKNWEAYFDVEKPSVTDGPRIGAWTSPCP